MGKDKHRFPDQLYVVVDEWDDESLYIADALIPESAEEGQLVAVYKLAGLKTLEVTKELIDAAK